MALGLGDDSMVAHFLKTLEQRYKEYSCGSHWEQDPVLTDDDKRYKDASFNMMLKKVYQLSVKG